MRAKSGLWLEISGAQKQQENLKEEGHLEAKLAIKEGSVVDSYARIKKFSGLTVSHGYKMPSRNQHLSYIPLSLTWGAERICCA